MRSRYSAYALAKVSYLIETTDPSGPQGQPDLEEWARQLRDYCERTRFRGLKIRCREHREPDDEGFVTFTATLDGPEGPRSFTERSRFIRVNGRWLYHSGHFEDESNES